ncbi:hypothetical protein VTI74DRAFT_11565 [Chaetomium olivicolor]
MATGFPFPLVPPLPACTQDVNVTPWPLTPPPPTLPPCSKSFQHPPSAVAGTVELANARSHRGCERQIYLAACTRFSKRGACCERGAGRARQGCQTIKMHRIQESGTLQYHSCMALGGLQPLQDDGTVCLIYATHQMPIAPRDIKTYHSGSTCQEPPLSS